MSTLDEQLGDVPGQGDGLDKPIQPDEPLGSVDKIREIIFGTQIREYDRRFALLEERFTRDVAEVRDITRSRLDALEARLERELELLSDRLTAERTQALDAGLDAVNARIQQGFNELHELQALLDRRGSELQHAKVDRTALADLFNEFAHRVTQPAESSDQQGSGHGH